MASKIPNKPDFQKALDDWFQESERRGFPNRDLIARELYYLAAGENPKEGNNNVRLCCVVMRENMKLNGDKEVPGGPPKGDGTRLIIRYVFPRTLINREQNVKTILPPPSKSFNWECAYLKYLKSHVSIFPHDNCLYPGCGRDKRGWHTLKDTREDYEYCPVCGGNGVPPGDVDIDTPCSCCKGLGLVHKSASQCA